MKIHDINRISRLRGVPKSQTWAYKPTERQGIFHRHSETYKLFGGAMGGGKSVALCAEAVKLSLKYPGNRGYLCRDQIVDFKRSTLVTFMNLVPKEMLAKHYRDDRLIVLRNGSEILYGGLGGEEDLERIKSTEFGWFVIDEATEVLEEMFVLLCSRLRWRLPDGSHPKYHGLLASNPEPGWVKDRFVDRNPADHIFIRALVTDNPHVPENYVARLRKIFPEEYVKRYIEGSWDVFEGQVYREFDRARHIVDIAEIGRYWERFRVIDHGYRNPTCCLWIAIDHDGAMWVYDEHYRAELTIDEHARIILDRHPGFDGLTLADPSMFSRTMQRGGRAWSPADEYRENGIVLMKPYAEDGWMSESTGINLVKQRLRSGSLFVSGECRNTIKELLHYRWKDYKPSVRMKRNTPENPVDKDNHACFPAGTSISTPEGNIAIENIRRGQAVYTHLGIGFADSDSMETGLRDTCSLIDSDTRESVECTPDHKFPTGDSTWMQAEDLDGQKLLRRLHTSMDCASISDRADVSKRPDRIRRATKTGESFIESFGNFMEARFQKAFMFIAKTAIKPTTESGIRKFFRPEIVSENMLPISLAPASPPRHGMAPPPGFHGTRNTAGKFGITGARSRESAISAENRTKPETEKKPGIAPTNANPRSAELPESTISREIANAAARLSELTAIRLRALAPVNVVESSRVRIEKGRSNVKVYSFSSSHGTYFADGFLAANCDCIRYAVAWRPAASQPPERKTDPDSIHSAIMAHKRQLGLPFYAGWN